MEPYIFSTTVDLKSLRRFNFYVNFRNLRGILPIIIGVIIFIASNVTYFGPGEMFLQDYIVFSLLGIVLIAYPVVIVLIRTKGMMARSEVFSEPLNYSFEPEGIRFWTEADLGEGEETESKLRWEGIFKVIETKDMLMIFSNRVNAFLVPLDNLSGDITKIREILRSQVDGYKLKLRS